MSQKRTQLNINLEPTLLKKLKIRAIEEDKTLSQYIVDILSKNLD